MKHCTSILAAIFFAITLLTFTAVSQETAQPSIATWGDHAIGFYIGTALKGSTIRTEAAGYLDLKAALTVDRTWAFGLAGSGLYYDKSLRELVNDGSYHLYAGYGGIFAERMFQIDDRVLVSVSILMGQGETYYRYDNDYRKAKVWYQETIDKCEFSVIEPSIELEYRVSSRLWLGATASVRSTSPIRMIGVSEKLLNTGTYGLSLKWGIF